MPNIITNNQNKTLKIRGDISISELCRILSLPYNSDWDGWIIMPLPSAINDPNNSTVMYESPDTIPEEFPQLNHNHIPNDGC
jgi:hypothetical protein